MLFLIMDTTIYILLYVLTCMISDLWTAGDHSSTQDLDDLVQCQTLQSEKLCPSLKNYSYTKSIVVCSAVVSIVRCLSLYISTND